MGLSYSVSVFIIPLGFLNTFGFGNTPFTSIIFVKLKDSPIDTES